MERRKLLKGIAALAIAERLGALQAAWAAGNQPITPGMHRITGQVTVNGQPAREGMLIKPGDTIVTGAKSEAIYVIGQDAYLQRDRSSVSITGDAIKSGLRLISGKLMSVFGKGDKKIETPTATIGIRGTGCYLETEENQVYFCLCYGVADVVSSADPAKKDTITTNYHDFPVFLLASGEKMMAMATVKNHSDAELILLESLVGRVPPFYGKNTYRY
jgi:hypothetical protein